MRSWENREQRAAGWLPAVKGPAPEWHICEVDGCNGRAFAARWCRRCTEEIEALQAMAADRAGRPGWRKRCRAWRERRGAVLEAAVVLAALVYFGSQFAPAVAAFLRGGAQ